MTAPTALVMCNDVSRTFRSGDDEVRAVRSANGAVFAGDRISITGQSGSGKSTLLHLIAGLDTPTSGRVSWPAIGDRSILRPANLGVVFQSPSLLPALTVVENCALPLLLMGASNAEADRRSRDALGTLGLSELADKLPEEISGGQAQRVAVARVLSVGPRLILADEPTGQLDQNAGGRVIDVLLIAADAANAALIVNTHDDTVAARFATRWSMADGHLTTGEQDLS